MRLWCGRAVSGDVPGNEKASGDNRQSVCLHARLDADVQQKLLDTMANTDKEELFNLVHACNSYPFEECPLSPELQRHLFF